MRLHAINILYGLFRERRASFGSRLNDVARKPAASTGNIRSIRGAAGRCNRVGRVGVRPEVGRNIFSVDNVWTRRYALATGGKKVPVPEIVHKYKRTLYDRFVADDVREE